MKIRLLAAFAIVAAAFIALAIGCQSKASDRKAGLPLNSSFEVAATLAETPVVQWNKASPDTAATTTTAEQPVGVIGPGPSQIALAGCQWNPGGAVGADASSNATITVYKRNSASDAGQTLAYISNASASWTAFTPVAMTAGDAGQYVAPGDSLSVAISKLDSGVIVPAGQVDCFTTLQ